MTRVGSYELYKCPKCNQIHIKSNYSSISISMPYDAWFAPTDLKTCQKCGEISEFSEYLHLESIWIPPGGFPKDQDDPRSIYPYFAR